MTNDDGAVDSPVPRDRYALGEDGSQQRVVACWSAVKTVAYAKNHNEGLPMSIDLPDHRWILVVTKHVSRVASFEPGCPNIDLAYYNAIIVLFTLVVYIHYLLEFESML